MMHPIEQNVQRRATPTESRIDLMARACRAVSKMYRVEPDSRDAWTQSAAEDLLDLVAGGASAMVLVGEWSRGDGAWRTISLGLAGQYPPGAVRALQDQASRGWPDDDFSRTLAHASERGVGVCGRREEMMDDGAWARSAYAAFRRSIGLYDLARAVMSTDEGGHARQIVLQIDGLSETWRAPRESVAALACVTQAMLDSYRRVFVEPAAARRRVLDSLSPTQQTIVPMLAEGMTEAKIAERIHRSAHTVHDHTRAIYRALGVRSRLELRDLWLGR